MPTHKKMLEITKIIIKKLDPRNGIKDWNFIPSYIKYKSGKSVVFLNNLKILLCRWKFQKKEYYVLQLEPFMNYFNN